MLRIDRLEQVIENMRVDRLLHVGKVGVFAQHEDLAVERTLLDLVEELPPVALGHAHVGDEDIHRRGDEKIQRLAAVFCLRRQLETQLVPADAVDEPPADGGFVLGDHNADHGPHLLSMGITIWTTVPMPSSLSSVSCAVSS